ncbi:MAG: hypothetical protein ABI234_00745 [Ktedonobacteraceae bacterium]
MLLGDSTIERIEELTVEMLIPPRRGDRVYKVFYKGEWHILHCEFESSSNSKMDKRLLVYHVLLWEKYELPIISIIVYPFQVTTVSSPLKERDADGEILSFRYRTVLLWKEDARHYINTQAVPFYGFLPAMDEITDDLLLHAIDDMVNYYRDDQQLLRDELLCFRVLLERAHRLPADEMLRVERRIHMFDPLLEESPWVKGKMAESKARGKTEGIAKGELQSTKRIILKIIQNRFPALSTAAEKRVEGMKQIKALDTLIDQLMQASSESEARTALKLPPDA